MLLPALAIERTDLESDTRLGLDGQGEVRVVVTKIRPDEKEATWYRWKPSDGTERTVQVTDNWEMSFFTEARPQDRHFHRLTTEVYTVIWGTMRIEANNFVSTLEGGDSIIVNPETVHEVLLGSDGQGPFFCQVLALNFGGPEDKRIVD